MEQRLREAEERFRLIAEMTSDYAYSFEVDEGGVLRAEWVTESVVRDLGYTTTELDAIGGPLAMVHPEDVSQAVEVLAQLRSGRSTPALELRLVAKDGRERWVRFHVRTVWDTQQQRLHRILGAAKDISVEKEAEAQRDLLSARLHQAERLETVGQMAGGIAHDFNNLLAIISNYSEFVQNGVDDVIEGRAPVETLGTVAEDLEQVQRATDRAAELTKRLLTFSRRSVVRPVALDLNAMLRDVESLLRRSLSNGIELTTAYADDLWTIEADPTEIEQALLNLALNAKDAMPDGGQLHIATANVDIAASAPQTQLRPGSYVSVTVADTGTGMSAETRDHAFEPFFTTKPRGSGTGLGLATVHGVVTHAGGGINVYSEPGLGTTIRIYLPRAVTDSAPKEETDIASLRSRGETVLVVEDEEGVRESTARILRGAGYSVLTAAGMSEALTRVRSDVDALITDVVMEEASGKEVAHAIVERVPGVVVVYISGYPHEVLTRRGVVETGVTLLEKPVPDTELLRTLRARLDGRPS